MLRYYYFIVLLLCYVGVEGIYGQKLYPKGGLVSPLNIPLELAGNFGEFRPNHFHTGLDFKTQQKENFPVFAVADGYVSRIAVSHTGYGYCLYINHSNGYTSVYAHLNSFAAPIAQYLKQEQIKAQKWNVDISIDTPLLLVKQGEQVALSGNTGGSVAPHLHFEIRDTKTERVINAMHFGFDIKDNIAPRIKKVLVYNANKSIYQQQPIVLTLKQSAQNEYFSDRIVEVPYEKVYIGVVADDYMNNSSNTLGIYVSELYADNRLVFKTKMDELDFRYSRDINAYTDYTYRALNKEWVHIFTQLKGNNLDFYQVLYQNGVVALNDLNAIDIKITLGDYYGNASNVNLNLKYNPISVAANSQNIRQGIVTQNQWYKFLVDSTAFYDEVEGVIDVQFKRGAISPTIHLLSANIPLARPQNLYIKLSQPIAFELRNKLVFLHNVKAQSLPGANPQSAMKATFVDGFAHVKIKTLGKYEVGIDTIAPQIVSFNIKNTKEGSVCTVVAKEDLTNIASFKAFVGEQFIVFSRKGNVFTSERLENYKGKDIKIIITDDNDNKLERKYRI